MNEFQRKVDRCLRRFETPYWTPHENLARLAEEVGELAREINARFGPKRKKKSELPGNLADEIGDILFTLACIANPLGVDLDACAARAIKKASTRDARRFPRRRR